MKKYKHLIVDISFGFGVRSAAVKEVIYTSYPYEEAYLLHHYDPPLITRKTLVNPIINFSVKLGLGF
jgi:hypothetical protein